MDVKIKLTIVQRKYKAISEYGKILDKLQKAQTIHIVKIISTDAETKNIQIEEEGAELSVFTEDMVIRINSRLIC